MFWMWPPDSVKTVSMPSRFSMRATRSPPSISGIGTLLNVGRQCCSGADDRRIATPKCTNASMYAKQRLLSKSVHTRVCSRFGKYEQICYNSRRKVGQLTTTVALAKETALTPVGKGEIIFILDRS